MTLSFFIGGVLLCWLVFLVENNFTTAGTPPSSISPYTRSDHISEAYLHCPKALIRADLWARARDKQENFPTLIKMLTDQLGDNLEGKELEKAEQEYQVKIDETLY